MFKFRSVLTLLVCTGVASVAAGFSAHAQPDSRPGLAPKPQPEGEQGPKPEGIEGLCDSTTPEKFATGFRFTEGPLWHDGRLHLVDLALGTLWSVNDQGERSLEHRPTNGGAGLAVDPDGRLLMAEFGGKVERRNADGKWETIAETYEQKHLNSPNDVIVSANGTVYFSDPGFGLGDRKNELGYEGVFMISPDGTLKVIDKTMTRPNGVALSPDEKTLYVSDSGESTIRAYTIGEDGAPVGEGRLFADLNPIPGRGLADGMGVDEHGNLYATGNGGISVWSPKGDMLGLINVRRASNCAFGGDDAKTLFITAGADVYRLPMKVRGVRFGKPMGN